MLAAERPCPPNKLFAAKKAWHSINNQINRVANLQAVLDDPAISKTVKMSDVTSADVPLLTDIAWTDVHA